MQEVSTLGDFRVKDERGHYVHYLSHAIYLAESILENKLGSDDQYELIAEALLDAYLRCDSGFGYDEDLILAELFLQVKFSPQKAKSIVERLAPKAIGETQNSSIEVAKNGNKRALWMSMFALNSNYKIYPDDVFAPTVKELIKRRFA